MLVFTNLLLVFKNAPVVVDNVDINTKSCFGHDQVHILSPVVTMNKRESVHVLDRVLLTYSCLQEALLPFDQPCSLGCPLAPCFQAIYDWPTPIHPHQSQFRSLFYGILKTVCFPGGRTLNYTRIPCGDAITCA